MDAILDDSPFFDFGEDALYPFKRTGLAQVSGEKTELLRAEVRKFAPRVPGVYGMIDHWGRLVYVGKSKALRNRLLSYFMPNNEEDKAGRIVQSAASIVWETQPNEFAALLREQSLIRQFQPRFNVQGLPKRQQPIFVCLGRPPAEQFYTARGTDTKVTDAKATTAIGPLFGATRASRAVEVLNRLFRLRDCSSKVPCSFTDQLQLFDIGMRPGCIRLEIQSCLGPCIAGCSRGDYEQQVSRGRAFLAGKDDSPVALVAEQMAKAAGNLHFEQAAVLREDLKAVKWLSRRAGDLARARENYTFVYPVQNDEHGWLPKRPPAGVWYLIRRGIVEGALAAPRDKTESQRARRLVNRWLEQDNRVGSRFPPRPETLALVTSWFRNHKSELKTTFLPKSSSRSPAISGNSSTVKV